MTKQTVKLLILLLLVSSCSSLVPEPEGPPKSSAYSVNFKRAGWIDVDPDSSDKAFSKSETGSIILVQTMCKKYEGSSLNALSGNLLLGIEKIEVQNENFIEFAGREAIQKNIAGKLDGVKTYLRVTTLRKNRCIYDLIMISSSEKKRERDRPDYDEFLSSLKIR